MSSEQPGPRPLRRLEERIRPDLRRAVGFGVVFLAALVTGRELNRAHDHFDGLRIASYGCALLVLVAGVLATRSTAGEFSRVAGLRAGVAATTPLRLLVQIVGYLLTLLAVLEVLNVDLSQFLVGGAVTGVVLGIAAQQTLGNFFAGMVLLLARPYTAGEYVRVLAGSINGPHEGTITDIGLLYTRLATPDGLLNIPNSVLLASAVGPAEPGVTTKDDDPPDTVTTPDPAP